jgi:hypothetical protein
MCKLFQVIFISSAILIGRNRIIIITSHFKNEAVATVGEAHHPRYAA